MINKSNQFLKRSAYHVSKPRDLDSALQKSKDIEEALLKLKSVKEDYEKETLIEATKSIKKSFHLKNLTQLVAFMSKLAKLPIDERKQVRHLVNNANQINDNSAKEDQPHKNIPQKPTPMPISNNTNNA